MKKINEVFTLNNGFFTELFNDNSDLYKQLFDDFKPITLNANFLALCGSRYIAPIVSVAQNMKTLTEMILDNYLQSWLKVKSALFAEYDIIKPVKVSVTTEREFTSNRDINSENTDVSSIYPFNEHNEEINEGKSKSNSANTVANTEKSTQTVTREGNYSTKPSDLIFAEIQTRKITFLSLVLNDIKEFCTLQIY